MSQNAPFEFARLLSRVLSFRALAASAKTIKDAIRALRRENAALRKLPAIPVHHAGPEQPAIRAHEHDAHIRAKTVRIDHDADS